MTLHLSSSYKLIFILALLTVLASPATRRTHANAQHAAPLPPIKPAEFKGDIRIDGSQVVLPISQRVAKLFKLDGFVGLITVDGTGSAKGIQRLCKGEIDIADSDVPMTPEQIKTCTANKVEPLQFKVATMSRQSRLVEDLTQDQLRAILSGKAKTWKDVDPKWPAQKISLLVPPPDSGTYEYLSDQIFKDAETDLKKRYGLMAAVPGVTLEPDFDVIAKKVSANNFSLGLVGYAYYQKHRSQLRVVSVDGVTPNDRTVRPDNANKYSFTRPLFVISSAKSIKSKPQVNAFLNYYLLTVNSVIADVGYFAQPPEMYEEAKKLWLGAQK